MIQKNNGMHNSQNMEHAPHASKTLKGHARQSNKHGNRTEIRCKAVPNHLNDASNAYYTSAYLRPTSPNTKELY